MNNIGVCGQGTKKWFVPTNIGDDFPHVYTEMKGGEYCVNESPYHTRYYRTFEEAFEAFKEIVGEVRFPKTQKAQGLLHCRIPGMPFQGFVWVDGEEDIKFAWEWAKRYYGLVFARPCPLTPRHGFVESRQVNSEEELLELLREVKNADPYGEILLTSLINASWNAIYTNGVVYIGRGHDGATAGKNVRFFPVSEPVIWGWKGEWGSPFVEMVKSDGLGWTTTQFRGGPKVDARRDFIPQEIVVKDVIWVDPDKVDALEWERKMKSLPEDTVVYHPGGSLTCHTAIHAIINQVPYVTSFEPKVGETLSPTTEIALKTPNWKRYFLAGFRLTFDIVKRRGAQEAALMSIYAFHHLSTSQDVSHRQLAAFFAGVWARLGAALVLGEQRHHGQAVHIFDNCKLFENGKGRSEVYEESLYYSDTELLNKLFISIRCMSKCRWHHQYGGKKWAACGRSVLRMIKARKYETLIAYWNNSVNLAHNGGWWFNKLLSKSDFDKMGDDFASQVAIIPSVVCTAEWLEQIRNTIMAQKMQKASIDLPEHYADKIIFTFLSHSMIDMHSVLSGEINYEHWGYEEFANGARWRVLEDGHIKLQFMYNHRRSMVLKLNDKIRQNLGEIKHEWFTLESLAGTNAKYAPAQIFINKNKDYDGHRLLIKIWMGDKAVVLVAESRW
jgi:hypothetical protein